MSDGQLFQRSDDQAPNTPQYRALLSGGASQDAIYRMAAEAIKTRHSGGGLLLDIGCGSGALRQFVRPLIDSYVGVDLVEYAGFPSDCSFYCADLNSVSFELPIASADIVVSLETIEHLENPRAFVRELVRLARPGGWVIVSTPNQLSLLSLFTLLTKHQFNQFQDVHYPAHISALLEVDLLRIGKECTLSTVAIEYSRSGRVVFTPWHYPSWLSRLFPRAMSDNLLMAGQVS